MHQCSSEIASDRSTFGISCVKHLVNFQEVFVEHSTDVARLKQDAAGLELVVIHNATLLMMVHGKAQWDMKHNGILITQGGIIHSVGVLGEDNFVIPGGPATVIDAEGGKQDTFLV